MAGRIRMLRPELLDDEVMASLSSDAWRIAVALVLLADDFGNVRFSDRYIGANVFQDTGRDVGSACLELVDRKLVTEYSVEGQRYAAIKGWTVEDGRFRQRLDNASRRSRVPGPEKDDGTNVRVVSAEPAASPPPPPDTLAARARALRSRSPISDPEHRAPSARPDAAAETADGAEAPVPVQPELKLEEPKAKKGGAAERIFAEYVKARKGWNPKARVSALVLGKEARREIAARLKDGQTEETLVLAARGIFLDPWEGRADQIDLKYAMREGNVAKFAELGVDHPITKWGHLAPMEAEEPEPVYGPPAPPPPELKAKLERLYAKPARGPEFLGGRSAADASVLRARTPLGPPPKSSFADDDTIGTSPGADVFWTPKAKVGDEPRREPKKATPATDTTAAALENVMADILGEEPKEAAHG